VVKLRGDARKADLFGSVAAEIQVRPL